MTLCDPITWMINLLIHMPIILLFLKKKTNVILATIKSSTPFVPKYKASKL
jgi:hypothetical protein